MTQTKLNPSERANLQVFRRVAAELHAAAQRDQEGARELRMVRGYIETEGEAERIRNLCIPVRRTYLPRDPINFRRILNLVRSTGSPDIISRSEQLERVYEPIEREIKSVSILNDRPVTHGEMFEAWIDAVVFFDVTDKRRRYTDMLEELGKAVEGIALHLAERMAVQILNLDDLVADVLGERRRSEMGEQTEGSSQ